ncbi:uncharacterized protein LOC144281264 [Canis aureus]
MCGRVSVGVPQGKQEPCSEPVAAVQGFLLGPLHPSVELNVGFEFQTEHSTDISAWAPCRHCPKCTPNMLAVCLANGTLAPRSWGADPGCESPEARDRVYCPHSIFRQPPTRAQHSGFSQINVY